MGTRAAADQAAAAYYPEARIDNTRLQVDSGNRTTVSVSQPLVSLDKWATRAQAVPRNALAEATLSTRQQDLAIRLLKAASAITTAAESIVLNEAKLSALDQQATRARKMYEKGQGTVTDVRDIEVKASQARAQHLQFKAQLVVAQKTYESITGVVPAPGAFALAVARGGFAVRALEDYLGQARADNPELKVAQTQERIAALEAERSRGALFPTLALTLSHSTSNGLSRSYVGVNLNFPLQAGGYYQMQGAQAGAQKARETRRQAEEKVRLDVERLRALVESGLAVLDSQREAIAAAELSVEANTKSFQGGVRSVVDVINAIQTLYQVKSDFVTAATTLAENTLGLELVSSQDVEAAMSKVQRLLFSPAPGMLRP